MSVEEAGGASQLSAEPDSELPTRDLPETMPESHSWSAKKPPKNDAKAPVFCVSENYQKLPTVHDDTVVPVCPRWQESHYLLYESGIKLSRSTDPIQFGVRLLCRENIL